MLTTPTSMEQSNTHLAHLELLKERLNKERSISFFDFMQQALYHPSLGFYTSQDKQFGEEGDFITAPEISPLFGYCIANSIKEVFAKLSQPSILEFGAGSGALMVSVLEALEKEEALPERYYVLEVSSALRARQKALVEERLPHLANRIIFLERLMEKPFRGVVLANEVLDAMPCQRFSLTDAGLFEVGLTLNQNNEISETLLPAGDELSDYCSSIKEFKAPYCSEYHPLVGPWLNSLAGVLESGCVFLFDYGFLKEEFYHPSRNTGTLMCHHRHRAHPNPYLNIGEQDITSHVNFSLVGDKAEGAGFSVLDYTSQARFLLDNDLLGFMRSLNPQSADYYTLSQAIKKLTHPEEMGEIFKVMTLGKNDE